MAVVQIETTRTYISGCDIYGERVCSLWYYLHIGPSSQTLHVIDVTISGPGSGYNDLPGINRSQGAGRSVMFTGSPRTRAEVLNEAPARARRGLRRRSKQ